MPWTIAEGKFKSIIRDTLCEKVKIFWFVFFFLFNSNYKKLDNIIQSNVYIKML